MKRIKPSVGRWAVAAAALAVAIQLPVVAGGGGGGSPPVPGEPFEGCGTLHVTMDQGIACTTVDTHTGGVYMLSDAGGFGEGDVVCVTGVFTECAGSELVCGPIQGCVTVGTIALEIAFQGSLTTGMSECGTFQSLTDAGATCVLFVGDSGWTYAITDESAPDPEELVGQRLRVTGQIQYLGCMSPCGPVQGCLNNPLIEQCAVPADLNGDGHVNTLDLGILLSNWSIPLSAPGCGGSTPCVADLNSDGVVNSLDLGALLSHWG